eukprot:Blabericola_migrator_1__6372@NODE_3210_length_1947_cov_56_451596_g1893_i1_p2_GENE_NODE_3210_length_1947_cov_56_451596_g1893_i1NODE_3210_length_1947_cov_56_451596_g1893_i1_p2_ORF_typecomplete_len102_score6_17_NODE_3210_length_1947_cov_56_451596_g1893_i1398703
MWVHARRSSMRLTMSKTSRCGNQMKSLNSGLSNQANMAQHGGRFDNFEFKSFGYGLDADQCHLVSRHVTVIVTRHAKISHHQQGKAGCPRSQRMLRILMPE